MNTLSILDANTANLPEGLYLELTNALKKDFNKNKKDKKNNLKPENIVHFLKGHLAALEFMQDELNVELEDCEIAESCCIFLNKVCDRQSVIEHIFNNQFNKFYYQHQAKSFCQYQFCELCNNKSKQDGCYICEKCDYVYCLNCADGIIDDNLLCFDCRPDLCPEHRNYQMNFYGIIHTADEINHINYLNMNDLEGITFRLIFENEPSYIFVNKCRPLYTSPPIYDIFN